MNKKGCKAAKLLIGLALMLSCSFQAACTRGIDEPANVGAALTRYRLQVDAMRPQDGPRSDADPDHALFASALRLVLTSYVTPSDPYVLVGTAVEGFRKMRGHDPGASRRVLTEAAIDSMLAALDPYSAFLDAEHVRDLREEIYGEYADLGAATAGVPAGEFPMRASTARKPVKFRPVTHRLDGDVAYIRIRQFNEHTSPQVTDAVESMRRQSQGRLTGAVLDLRDNDGGLFEQGVRVAAQFLGTAEIVSARGHGIGTRRYFADASSDLLPELPTVVLINSRTASAAEIVAGALQDYDRALLVGTRSFGKGSVQTVYWLPGGEGIRLTTAHYFRPSGAGVDCYGISPNVAIEPSAQTMRPGRAACDPAAVPPSPKTWPMAELCPEIARAASRAAPSTRPDLPLECALAAIRAKRVPKPVRTRATTG